MSELQNLVPPLELCRKIPPGQFKDSAMVWLRETGNSGRYYIAERNDYLDRVKRIPAPTLQEILDRLSEFGEPVTVTQWKTGQIAVSCQINDDVFEEVSQDGASAALKLWLEIYNQ